MNMRKVLNWIQAILIALWTVFCGLSGMILILLTWQRNAIMLLMSHYIWSPVICAVSGVRVEVHGVENVDRDLKAIYVANHSSLYDIVAVSRACPVPLFYIAKKELFKVPVMGQFMWLVGMIFIDRKNKERAMQSMEKAARSIQQGRNIISFPEGTRSKNGKISLFKRGSFIIAKNYNIPVVPIAISGAHEILSSGSTGLRPGTIRVYFEKPMMPDHFQHLTEEELAAQAREIILRRLS